MQNEKQTIETWRCQLARLMLRALSIIGGIAAGLAAYQAYLDDLPGQIPVRLGIYAIIVAVAFWPDIDYRIQVVTVIAVFCGFAAFNLTQFGLNAESGLFFFSAALISAIFFGTRGGIALVVLVLLILIGMGWLFTTERVVVYITETTRSADWPGWLLFSFIFLALALGLTFAINYILNRMVAALDQSRRLTEALDAERAGLEAEVAERTRHAEQAREAAEAANRALEEQMWHVAGQAQLSEVMRGDLDLPTLAARVIHQLCHTLEAQAGALFVVRKDALELMGRYALPENHERRAPLGEDLVGQVAQDRQRRLLQDVPERDFDLVSGLGQVKLRHLLLVPFVYESYVGGVIEIGKLAPFTSAEIAFVEQSAPGIAIAFNTAQSRARIDALLAETQVQAEELQAQEEELRAINEELHAQAEALRAQQAQRETR